MSDLAPWTVDHEVQLFHALRKSKPVGVNKHFNMLRVHERLRDSIQRPINEIWDHLRTMYDLQALDESERVPFPNYESEFLLPDLDYSDLLCASYPRAACGGATAAADRAAAAAAAAAPAVGEEQKPTREHQADAKVKSVATPATAHTDRRAGSTEKAPAADKPSSEKHSDGKQTVPERQQADSRQSERRADASGDDKQAADRQADETSKRAAKRGRPSQGAAATPQSSGGSAAKRRRT